MDIRICGKNIVRFYKHHIMCLAYRDAPVSPDLYLSRIDPGRIAQELGPIGTTVTVKNLGRLIRKNPGKCEGFKLMQGERAIGTIWVLYKGSDDLEYRIRDIDAYIFDVFIKASYRGHGNAGEMIRHLMRYLHGRGIDTAHLAVSVHNKSALRAYRKIGFSTVKDCSFARILKINIPYHVL